jgi:hypothetical protein
MIFDPVCQKLLIRFRITRGKGEGRIVVLRAIPKTVTI